MLDTNLLLQRRRIERNELNFVNIRKRSLLGLLNIVDGKIRWCYYDARWF